MYVVQKGETALSVATREEVKELLMPQIGP